MKRFALILTAVCAITLSTAPASATDLCLFDGNIFGLSIVGKAFTVPTIKNTCKPFNGFYNDAMIVGTGCTNHDASLFRLHFTMHQADHDYFASVACNFVLPGVKNGNCHLKEINAVDSVFNRHSTAFAHKVACTAVPVP
jgi:hypothetical protein